MAINQSLFKLEFRNNLTTLQLSTLGLPAKNIQGGFCDSLSFFIIDLFLTFLLGSVATNYKIIKIRVHSWNSRCFSAPSTKSSTLWIPYKPPILNFMTVSDFQSFPTRFRGKIWFSNESRAFASTDKKNWTRVVLRTNRKMLKSVRWRKSESKIASGNKSESKTIRVRMNK